MPDPDDDQVLLISLHPFEARPLLDRLEEAGVLFSVVNDEEARARGGAGAGTRGYVGVNVLVAREDHARASEIQQEMVRESLPDLPDDFAPGAGDADACPACGTALAPDAQQCAECGLEFPDANG